MGQHLFSPHAWRGTAESTDGGGIDAGTIGVQGRHFPQLHQSAGAGREVADGRDFGSNLPGVGDQDVRVDPAVGKETEDRQTLKTITSWIRHKFKACSPAPPP